MSETGVKVFEAVMLPLQRLPLGFHYAWGRAFAWVAEHVLRYRRDVVLTNLARSFPDAGYGELRQMSHGFYAHLGEIVAETLWFGGCKGRPGRLVRQGIVRIPDSGELFASFSERPGGVMILGSHWGNWELFGGMFQYFGDRTPEEIPVTKEQVCVVYKRLENRFWDRFMADNRCAVLEGLPGYVESREVLRYAVAHRGEKRFYIFSTDQFPYRFATRHQVPSFLGQVTQVMTGGAALAHKLSLAVYYLGMERTERGKYEMTFRKICEDASQMEPEAVMERFCALLEADVRRQPANYLWSHKRWK